MEKATFAAGCFWCIESVFLQTNGVINVQSGYTGGHLPNPTYEEVCSGTTGHFEAIEITYNPEILPFEKMLSIYWQQIDPFDFEGQFADRGSQYRTAIFYHTLKQKELAEQSKQQLASLWGKNIATQIHPASQFYPAEEYHQKYCYKQPLHFQLYNQYHQLNLQNIWKKGKDL